ncbi:MAG: hypothetical protein IPO78_15610 [Saprospiraceae bacterium]|nr:hypothetical protein [Saprospiraceae bacterium]
MYGILTKLTIFVKYHESRFQYFKFQFLNAESFSISIWRKAIQNTKAGIVATCNAKQFYNGNFKILEKDSNNWEKLWMEFSMPKQSTDQELVIYMYNPDSNPVYFDDLEIKYYKSILMELPKTY